MKKNYEIKKEMNLTDTNINLIRLKSLRKLGRFSTEVRQFLKK